MLGWALRATKITFAVEDIECDVREIRELLDHNNKISTVSAMDSVDNIIANIVKPASSSVPNENI